MTLVLWALLVAVMGVLIGIFFKTNTLLFFILISLAALVYAAIAGRIPPSLMELCVAVLLVTLESAYLAGIWVRGLLEASLVRG